MSCKYCAGNSEVIYSGECELEIFDSCLDFSIHNHYTADVYSSFKINYCPMCGRELDKEELVDG